MMKLKTASSAAVVAGLLAGSAHAGDVTIKLSGLQARPGQVLTTLQTRDQFMKADGAYNQILPARPGELTVVFKDVAPGDYAFSALHDEDGNGRAKLAANGMPEEGVAMLGGETLRGPPTFEVVKFTVPPEGKVGAATMIYFDGKFPGGAPPSR